MVEGCGLRVEGLGFTSSTVMRTEAFGESARHEMLRPFSKGSVTLLLFSRSKTVTRFPTGESSEPGARHGEKGRLESPRCRAGAGIRKVAEVWRERWGVGGG